MKRVLLTLTASALALAACALPWRSYPVSPPLSGTVELDTAPDAETRLVLRVHHTQSPALVDQYIGELTEDCRFALPVLSLRVAGQEYSKRYRLYLSLASGESETLIWRAEYNRRHATDPVRLVCDVDRPNVHGQRCQVEGAASVAWLVSAGEREYRARCSRCHGIDGSGAAKRSADRTSRPPDLREIASRAGGTFDRTRVLERIDGRSRSSAHENSAMPIWGEVIESEYERIATRDELLAYSLDLLATYLESIQHAHVSAHTH